MMNSLRKKIKAEIDKTTGLVSHFINSGNNSSYPYITFNLKEIDAGYIDKHIYELTVDAWDKIEVKRIIEAIDDLDRRFKQFKDNNSEMVLLIYHGSGKGFLDDEDKSIKRLERKYEVIAYEKGDKI